jgi:hypothetical protein
MIGFFADPYPDELLYSACARFSDKMKCRDMATAARELFGGKYGMAVVDFPNRLGHLISVMPPGHGYTVDRLIDENTPLRFYEPFIPAERVRLIRQEMGGTGYNRIHARLGVAADRFSHPTSLRFCPECVSSDRQKYREAYWHRIHQLPGIEVCPEHAVFLEPGGAAWVGRRNSNAFVSAERSVPEVAARSLDVSNSNHKILLKLAEDAIWLLNWRGTSPDNLDLRDRYFNLLLRRDLACHSGMIRHIRVIERFLSFYSADFLKQLQSEVRFQGECWVLRIVRTHKARIVQQPLRHLLLMTFLNVTAEEIFTEFEEYKPFGAGPWPCLNRASSHFGQMTIPAYSISGGTGALKGRPIAVFSCDCKFIYSRIGPDSSDKDRFNFTSVVSYGSVWETYLKEKWEDPSITLDALAKGLGVCPTTLRRHALRLNLPFPRKTPFSKPASEKFIKRYSNMRKSFEEYLRIRQEHWLEVRKANPKMGRTELITIASFTYYWLRKNALEWLEDNLPESQKCSPPPKRVDWDTWDTKLPTAIKQTVTRIKGFPGRPTRVIKETIIREVGHRSWIEKSMDKLPQTARAFNKALELGENFLLRCVKWAEDSFYEEGVCPTRHKFEVRAGTRTKTGEASKVQRAIDVAMKRLSKSFN